MYLYSLPGVTKEAAMSESIDLMLDSGISLNSGFLLVITLPMGAVAKYCDKFDCLCVCLSVCLSVRTEDISGTACATFTKFCVCCLGPWLGPPLAWDVKPCSFSTSGILTIGRIAYRWEVGDGSAQHGQNVIYDCLVVFLLSIQAEVCHRGQSDDFRQRISMQRVSKSRAECAVHYVDERRRGHR